MTRLRSNLVSIKAFAAIIVIALSAVWSGWVQTALASSEVRTQEWKFRVYLGDSAIGHHNFRLTEQAGQRTLLTEADFRVRFLFLTAYRYQHLNTEIWQGDCLQKIESRTDANGRILNVNGWRGPAGFEFHAPVTLGPVPDCVKTFAYWDAGILEEDTLLNPQTGELMPITVEQLPEEELRVRGLEIPARKYRLITKDLSLDIWYSTDREWLALESTTKDGRKLRYELI
jgi:Family of unknown function (DUF6134)